MVTRINVLGPVSMTLDDRPVPLAERKQRILLGILALENRLVEMARLVQLLWPDDRLPQNPNAQVNGYVNRIREALNAVSPGSEKMLKTRRGVGYQLEIDESAVDYHRFRRLAAQAKLALRDDPVKSAELGRAALAEWGPPAGVRGGHTPLDAAGESQLEGITEALRQEYQAALMTCLTAELECGRHKQILTELARLAGYDQYGAENPELARMRMLATYRSGDKTEALAIYDRFSEALDDRLAAEPDEETKKLRRQIMKDDPALRPARAEAQPDSEERPAEHPAGSLPASTAPTVHQEGITKSKIKARTVKVTNVIEQAERSALDTMRRNLSHDDVVERIKAARWLAQDRYPEAVPDVTRQLRREDRAEAQYWLVQALGSAGGNDAIQALTTFSKSAAAQNPLIQSRISKALGIARKGGLGFASAGRQGGAQ